MKASSAPIVEVARADEARFSEIFAQETPFVWNNLRRLGVPPSDVEDLAHEVFITFYRRLAEYDPARPVRPWLFGIALRVAMRYRELAHHRREVRDGAQVEVHDPSLGADEQLVAHQRRQLLERALESLSIEQRAVFVLHDIESQAMPEVAAALEIPLNTAYSRLRLAREGLSAALKRLRLQQKEGA